MQLENLEVIPFKKEVFEEVKPEKRDSFVVVKKEDWLKFDQVVQNKHGILGMMSGLIFGSVQSNHDIFLKEELRRMVTIVNKDDL